MLTIDTSTDVLDSSLKKSYLWMFLTAFFVFVMLETVLVLSLRRLVSDPINVIMSRLGTIRDGKLRLRVGSDVRNDDEIGTLSDNIDSMTDGLQQMVREIRNSAESLTQSSGSLSHVSHGLSGSTHEENSQVLTVTESVRSIDKSIEGAKQSLEQIVSSSDESSSAISEIRSTITSLHDLSKKLSAVIAESDKMIQAMFKSQRELNEAIDGVYGVIEQTAVSIHEMNATIHEIGNRALDSERLTLRNQTDALNGSDAVNKTLAGMETLHKEINETSALMIQLGKRSESIGQILDVIQDLNEQTNLLALNAAIISAEAGQHGKSFQVVSDQMRALSQKTAHSALEIQNLINTVQKESTDAAIRMQQLVQTANSGLDLSKQSAFSLEQILKSVSDTLEASRFISRTTKEQSSGIDQLTAGIEKIRATTGLIRQSAGVQESGAAKILETTTRVVEFTTTLGNAMDQELSAAQQIQEAALNISKMIHLMVESLHQQGNESKAIVRAMEKIKKNSAANLSLIDKLLETINSLDQVAKNLNSKINRFET